MKENNLSKKDFEELFNDQKVFLNKLVGFVCCNHLIMYDRIISWLVVCRYRQDLLLCAFLLMYRVAVTLGYTLRILKSRTNS